MRDVFGVNYIGDKGFMTGGCSGVYHSMIFCGLMSSMGSPCASPSTPDELRDAFRAYLNKDTRTFSEDHAVSYYPFTLIDEERQKFDVGRKERKGAVVFDQHIDAYKSYKGLNRANVYRRLLEEGKLDHVVFVGARSSENAIYMGKTGRFDPFGKAIALLYGNEFSGIRDSVNVIPLDRFERLTDCLCRSLNVLRSRGVDHIGIDFDMDFFDSEKVKGVGYSKNALSEIPFPERLFIRRQLGEKGYDPDNIEAELDRLNGVLDCYRGRINIIYRGVTEIELENEDPGSDRTERLVRSFAEHF